MLQVRQRIAGVIRKFTTQETEHDLSKKIDRGNMIYLMLQSHEWKRGLNPILEEMRETFSLMLQRGNELDPNMEKARGALDCISKIHSAMADAIAAGHKAQAQIAKMKERTNVRRT